MKNWKTTTLGILTIIGAICAVLKGILGDGLTEADITGLLGALGGLTGFGLILAKDAPTTGDKKIMRGIVLALLLPAFLLTGCTTTGSGTGSVSVAIDWNAVAEVLNSKIVSSAINIITQILSAKSVGAESENNTHQAVCEASAFAYAETLRQGGTEAAALNNANAVVAYSRMNAPFSQLIEEYMANPKAYGHQSDLDTVVQHFVKGAKP